MLEYGMCERSRLIRRRVGVPIIPLRCIAICTVLLSEIYTIASQRSTHGACSPIYRTALFLSAGSPASAVRLISSRVLTESALDAPLVQSASKGGRSCMRMWRLDPVRPFLMSVRPIFLRYTLAFLEYCTGPYEVRCCAWAKEVLATSFCSLWRHPRFRRSVGLQMGRSVFGQICL